VFLLRRHGLTVRRLEDGFPEWKAADLPVTTGDRDGKFDAPAEESLKA
jgi:3-mercaptopyruvate sulfurtransferase SseA